jgi:alpha-amylase/alpha-mannosidase (GH57 family)
MRVAILWHMHQPNYWDAALGTYRYPWAFLHAARHYHMMGVLAAEHPEAAITINITPVLMEQLSDYSREDFRDQLLEVIRKPAADLNTEEVGQLVDHVFKLNVRTMIDPYPRYRELKSILEGSGRRRVRAQELLDLQTLYLLTWCGHPLRQIPEMADLYRKGKNFTEAEKEFVFSVAHRAVKEVLPLYRKLSDAGHVELSTTPYYHPILPLVIDCDVARESRPDVHIDEVSFRYPQDARWHVEEAMKAYTAQMGKPPAGMWPAEGGVSDAALELLADCGLKWAATDEAVLSRSLGRFPLSAEEKYRPYRFRSRDLLVYFRDHELSDRIGFVYSGWNPVHAAEDVIGRLHGIREQLGRKRSEAACVSIILDGENPWEYYPDSGMGFLSRLYEGLGSSPALQPMRMGEREVRSARLVSLSHVVPGSWIDANFDTWIGAREKNRAWMLLATARRKLAVEAPQAEVPREFYRAEGSDWFWWLGPGHDTPYEGSYENLFRTNLIEGLHKAGLEVPTALRMAPRFLPSPLFQPPTHLFTPVIDGKRGNYYDWIAAGYYRASQGSTHRTDRFLEQVRFGFDARSFFLRLEGKLSPLVETREDITVQIEFAQPRSLRLLFRQGKLEIALPDGKLLPSTGKAAMESTMEIAIPREEIGGEPGQAAAFAVAVSANGDLLERLPDSGQISLAIPGPDFGLENWSV